MTLYRYRVYYKWQGSSHSDPFAQEKTAAEIEHALCTFPSELRHRLCDSNAEIITSAVQLGSTEVELFVKTTATLEVLQAALAPTLQDWGLLGEILRAPNAP